MQRRLARFPAGECWGQQDVGHGVVATGRGALQLRSLIATLRGLIYSLFPRDVELASSNQHRTKEMRMHFRGVKQAAAKIYINGFKNTEFFENCTKYVFLIFVKSTRVTPYSSLKTLATFHVIKSI
ncbi:hypothetical protein [Rummeliibacillus suwonensis]|uniref:hypothetical protein n=1 Tax=Rummeliibacillus suwonensis TaxID=1306154 RepID=UPI0011B47888|nr:hypothetical protein [Rummeliibacillus suwonensis]